MRKWTIVIISLWNSSLCSDASRLIDAVFNSRKSAAPSSRYAMVIFFFFLSGFSFTDTDDSQNIPPAHEIFRLLFATFHVWWLSHIFNRTACIYQTTTRLDLPPHRITIWLIDDVTLVFVCLRDDWIWFFVTAIWDGKPVNSNSHRLSPLFYKRTD